MSFPDLFIDPSFFFSVSLAATPPLASTSSQKPSSDLIITLPSPVSILARTPRSRKGKEKAIEEEDASDAAAVEAAILPNRSTKSLTVAPASTSISVAVAEGGSSVPGSFTQQKIKWVNRMKELYPLVQVPEKANLEDGLLVWVSFPGIYNSFLHFVSLSILIAFLYPFSGSLIFPGEVIDPGSDRATQSLLDAKPTSEGSDKLVLVSCNSFVHQINHRERD